MTSIYGCNSCCKKITGPPITPPDSSIEVSLTGILWSTIPSTLLKGSNVITVENVPTTGPSAVFTITKQSISITAGVNRTVSSAGSSGEQLELRWNPNQEIELRKDILNVSSDGIYLVKVY